MLKACLRNVRCALSTLATVTFQVWAATAPAATPQPATPQPATPQPATPQPAAKRVAKRLAQSSAASALTPPLDTTHALRGAVDTPAKRARQGVALDGVMEQLQLRQDTAMPCFFTAVLEALSAPRTTEDVSRLRTSGVNLLASADFDGLDKPYENCLSILSGALLEAAMRNDVEMVACLVNPPRETGNCGVDAVAHRMSVDLLEDNDDAEETEVTHETTTVMEMTAPPLPLQLPLSSLRPLRSCIQLGREMCGIPRSLVLVLLILPMSLGCSNQLLVGLNCTPCADGSEPNILQDGCVRCAADSAGTRGRCERCEDGFKPNHGQTACVQTFMHLVETIILPLIGVVVPILVCWWERSNSWPPAYTRHEDESEGDDVEMAKTELRARAPSIPLPPIVSRKLDRPGEALSADDSGKEEVSCAILIPSP